MTTVYFLDYHEKVVATVQYYGTDKAKVMEKAISDWKNKYKNVGYYYAYIPKFKKEKFLNGGYETSFKQDSIRIAIWKLEAEYKKTDSEAEKKEITKKILDLRLEWLKELK